MACNEIRPKFFSLQPAGRLGRQSRAPAPARPSLGQAARAIPRRSFAQCPLQRGVVVNFLRTARQSFRNPEGYAWVCRMARNCRSWSEVWGRPEAEVGRERFNVANRREAAIADRGRAGR